jgi:hypothetical protein
MSIDGYVTTARIHDDESTAAIPAGGPVIEFAPSKRPIAALPQDDASCH